MHEKKPGILVVRKSDGNPTGGGLGHCGTFSRVCPLLNFFRYIYPNSSPWVVLGDT